MSKFIEVHIDGRGLIINAERVVCVEQNTKGKAVAFTDKTDYSALDETYEEVRSMLMEE